MKHIGVSVPLPDLEKPDNIIEPAIFARAAEAAGFESVWCAEHVTAPAVVTQSQSAFFVDGQVPGFLDSLISCAHISALTSTIKIGTSVLLVAEHHPVRLAKELATLDRLSNGRFLLGVGAGWLREEAEIMGVDFDHRWSQVREAVVAMKALWTGEVSEYHGMYYDYPPLRCLPTPMQKPHPPIYLGGVAPRVLHRVVAYGDGWAPERITPVELAERRQELAELAREAGRDPQSIHISIHGKPADPDLVGAYFEAGADRVVIMGPKGADDREREQGLRDIAAKVFPVARRY